MSLLINSLQYFLDLNHKKSVCLRQIMINRSQVQNNGKPREVIVCVDRVGDQKQDMSRWYANAITQIGFRCLQKRDISYQLMATTYRTETVKAFHLFFALTDFQQIRFCSKNTVRVEDCKRFVL